MSTKFELPFDTCFACFQKSDDNCSCKSRKIYEQGMADALNIDLDTPMHFTNEQKAWVKKYISINGERQRADGAKEFAEWIHKYLGYSNDVLFTYRQSPVGFVVASKKSVDEIYAEWKKEKRMKLTQEEARLQDVVEIPDEYFELDHQRKELIDEVIRKLHESQKRGAK